MLGYYGVEKGTNIFVDSKILTFHEWMHNQYEDNWPVSDEDLSIWNAYIDYVNEVIHDSL